MYIECILNPGKEPRLYLNTTQPFFDSNTLPQDIFARGAMATITGTAGTDILTPDSLFDKFRCRWIPYYQGTIAVQQGNTYTLDVSYQGKTYTAQTTISSPKVEIDSILYVAAFYDLFGGHDGVQVFFTDATGTENFYRFQMNRMIDNTIHHAHVFGTLPNTCAAPDELFPVIDLGRTIYNDNGAD
ncbi:MAG: DUF4249 family protein [Chitinophagales bacterium]